MTWNYGCSHRVQFSCLVLVSTTFLAGYGLRGVSQALSHAHPGTSSADLDDAHTASSALDPHLVTDPEAAEGNGPAHHWNYDNVQHWKDVSSDCKGSRQSPIDILASEITPVPDIAGSLRAHMTITPTRDRLIHNNGHALQVDGLFAELELPDGVYRASQLHFHFPSEHAIDNMLTSGEMHIIFQREDTQGADALAIVAVLLQDSKLLAADQDQDRVTAELDFFRQLGLGRTLPDPGEARMIVGEVDLDVFTKGLSGNFYHYFGSLTTPPCTETVHWYILEKPAAVSTLMVDNFKDMFKGATNRPTQERSGRHIGSAVSHVEEEPWNKKKNEALMAPKAGSKRVVGSTLVQDDPDEPWAYDRTSKWADANPDCGGAAQSPIDIVVGKLTKVETHDAAVLADSLHFTEQFGRKLHNTGHSLQVEGEFGSLTLPDGVYNMVQFHFHFPSEHAINHILAAGEMHMVYARKSEDGKIVALAVIAVLLQDNEHIASHAWQADTDQEVHFFRKIGLEEKLPGANESHAIPGGVNLADFVRGAKRAFFHYQGSLTTPPCSEIVHWYVLERPSVVTPEMIKRFHNVIDEDTNRPVQPLNTRTVVNSELSIPGEFDDASADVKASEENSISAAKKRVKAKAKTKTTSASTTSAKASAKTKTPSSKAKPSPRS